MSIVQVGIASPKDSLLLSLDTKIHDSLKVANIHQLINGYANDIPTLKKYLDIGMSLAERMDNDKTLLDLVLAAMSKACKMDTQKHCNDFFDILNHHANKYSRPRYKVKGLHMKARVFSEAGDYVMAKKILGEIKDICLKNKFIVDLSFYYNELSIMKRQIGELDSCLYYNNLAIEPLVGKNYEVELAQAYTSRGRIYRYIGLLDSAKVYYLKCEKIALESKREDILATTYNNLGNIKHIQGEYNEAISYYIQSIEKKKKSNDKRGLSIGHHNIGAIKIDMKAYKDAIISFKRSNKLANQVGYKTINIHNDIKIGNAFQLIEKYDSAQIYHHKAMESAREIKFKNGEAIAIVALGYDYLYLNQNEKSKQHLLDGLALSRSIKSKSEECTALVGLAQWYGKINKSNTEYSNGLNDLDIEKILLDASRLSEEMNYSEKRLLVLDGLAQFYTKTGASNKLVKILKSQMLLKDTLYSKHRSNAITEWETKYETAEKELEIVQLNADKKLSTVKTKFWQWGFGISVLFFMFIGFLIFKYLKTRNARKRLEESETFRSKLSSDLHDDVGTILSSLAMQSEMMSLNATEEQAAKFNKLSAMSRTVMGRLRDTVWAIDARKDRVVDLVDRMTDYLDETIPSEKMSVIFNKKINTDIKNPTPEIRRNIYLIFKEALNNALKYSNGNEIKIDLIYNNNHIQLSIHDNGTVDSNMIKLSGTGLVNMKDRAEHIGGELTISTDDGYSLLVKVSYG